MKCKYCDTNIKKCDTYNGMCQRCHEKNGLVKEFLKVAKKKRKELAYARSKLN